MVVDCHIHMALDGGYWKDALARHKEAPDEQFIRKTLETYKSLGFTYLRDGGDRWDAGKRASELAPEYGIRYRTPVFPIYRKGHSEALSDAASKRLMTSARLFPR